MRMLLVVCFLAVCIYLQARYEGFVTYAANEVIPRENTGTSPWQRHTATLESIPVDPQIKYKRAYYYEMSNEAFQEGLQKALANTCEGTKLAKETDNWDDITNLAGVDPYISEIYQQGLEQITKVLNTTNTLKLSNGSPYLLQIVHDVLVRVQKHTKEPLTYMLDVDTIIYREFAAHAKHVHFVVFGYLISTTNGWKVEILSQNVKGIVSPESIQLHPTLKVDPIEMNQMQMHFNPDPLVPYPTTLLDAETIDLVVTEQLQKQKQAQITRN